MQTKTTAENLIYTGRFPFQSFGSQTNQNFPKPNPQRALQPTTGPNDTTVFNFVISLRTLTKYTGSDEDNYYLITLPSVIDRPKTIQVSGNTISHNETGVNYKTLLIQTPIVKQSGFTLDTITNTTTTSTDSIMGILRVPHASNIDTMFSIATTQVITRVPIKEQGYSQLIGIPIRFLNTRGQALSIVKDSTDGDISADGELMIQIVCESYNPAKTNART